MQVSCSEAVPPTGGPQGLQPDSHLGNLWPAGHIRGFVALFVRHFYLESVAFVLLPYRPGVDKLRPGGHLRPIKPPSHLPGAPVVS